MHRTVPVKPCMFYKYLLKRKNDFIFVEADKSFKKMELKTLIKL